MYLTGLEPITFLYERDVIPYLTIGYKLLYNYYIMENLFNILWNIILKRPLIKVIFFFIGK